MANDVTITYRANDKLSLSTQTTMSKSGKAVRDFTKNSDRQVKSFSKSFGQNWKRMSVMVTASFVAMGFALKKFIDLARDFQSEVVNMAKVSDENLDNIKNRMLQIPVILGNAIALTKGYYQTISAGVTNPINALNLLITAAKTAKAAHIETDLVIKGLTAVMSGYEDQIKNTTDAANLFFAIEKAGKTTVAELIPVIGGATKIAKELEIQVNEFAAGFATITQTAGSTEEAMTRMTGIMVALFKPTKELDEMFKSLGFTSGAAMIKQLGFIETIKTIKKEAELTGVGLGKLIGRKEALIAVTALATRDYELFDEKLKIIENRAGSMSSAFENWKNSFEGLSEEASNFFINLSTEIGGDLLPNLRELVEQMMLWVEQNREMIKVEVVTWFQGFIVFAKLALNSVLFLIAAYKKLQSIVAESASFVITSLQGYALSLAQTDEILDKGAESTRTSIEETTKAMLKLSKEGPIAGESVTELFKDLSGFAAEMDAQSIKALNAMFNLFEEREKSNKQRKEENDIAEEGNIIFEKRNNILSDNAIAVEEMTEKEWKAYNKLIEKRVEAETDFANKLLQNEIELTEDILEVWVNYNEFEQEMYLENLLNKKRASDKFVTEQEKLLKEREAAAQKTYDATKGFFNDMISSAISGTEKMGGVWESVLNKMKNVATSIMAQIATSMTMKAAGGLLSLVPGLGGGGGFLSSIPGLGGGNPLSLFGAGKTGMSIFDAFKTGGLKGAFNAGVGFDVFKTPSTSGGFMNPQQAADLGLTGKAGTTAGFQIPPWLSTTGQIAGAAIGTYGLYQGYKSGDKGSSVMSGAGTGASIGSMIAPGVGTAIGAVIGAIVGGITGALGASSVGTKLHRVHEAERYESLLRKMSVGTKDKPFDITQFKGIEDFLGSEKAGQGISRFTESSTLYGIGKYLNVRGEGLTDQLRSVGESLKDYKKIVDQYGGSSIEASLASQQMSDSVNRLDRNFIGLTEEGRNTIEMFKQLRENAIALQLKDISTAFQNGSTRIAEYSKQLDILDLGEQETATLKYSEALKFLTDETMIAFSGELSIARDILRESKDILDEVALSAEQVAIKTELLTSNLEFTDEELAIIRDTSTEVNLGLLQIYETMGLYDQQVAIFITDTREATNAQEFFKFASEDLKSVLDQVNIVMAETDELLDRMNIKFESKNIQRFVNDLYEVADVLEQVSNLLGAGTGLFESGQGVVDAFLVGDWTKTQEHLLSLIQNLNIISGIFVLWGATDLALTVKFFEQMFTWASLALGIWQMIESIINNIFGIGKTPPTVSPEDFAKTQIEKDFSQTDAINLFDQFADILGGGAIAKLDFEARLIQYRTELAIAEFKAMEEAGAVLPEGWKQIFLDGSEKAIKDLRESLAEPFRSLSRQLEDDIESILGTRDVGEKLKDARREFVLLDIEDEDYLSKAQEIRDLILERYAIEKQGIEDVRNAFQGVYDTVDAQLRNIQTSSSSPENIQKRLEIQLDEVNRLKDLVAGSEGVEKAGFSGKLAEALGFYLTLAQEAYQRPSLEYQAIFDMVTSELEKIRDSALTEISAADQQLIDLNEQTANELGILNLEIKSAIGIITGISDSINIIAETVDDGSVNTRDTRERPPRNVYEFNFDVDINGIGKRPGRTTAEDAEEVSDIFIQKVKREFQIGELAELLPASNGG